MGVVRNLLLNEKCIESHKAQGTRMWFIVRACCVNVRRMWTGLGATVLRDAPFSALYWVGYENMKKHLLSAFDIPNAEAHMVHIVCGGASGMMAALLTHPIDVVKTRIQSQYNQEAASASKELKQSLTIRNVVQSITREEGMRGLFRGLLPRVAKVAPSCAIMISSYEFFKTLYGVEEAAPVVTVIKQE